MQAWKKVEGLAGSDLEFVADPFGSLTAALGLALAIPDAELGPNRGKRAALFVANGVIKHREVSEADGDPTGDEHNANSSAEHMLSIAATFE